MGPYVINARLAHMDPWLGRLAFHNVLYARQGLIVRVLDSRPCERVFPVYQASIPLDLDKLPPLFVSRVKPGRYLLLLSLREPIAPKPKCPSANLVRQESISPWLVVTLPAFFAGSGRTILALECLAAQGV